MAHSLCSEDEHRKSNSRTPTKRLEIIVNSISLEVFYLHLNAARYLIIAYRSINKE